MIMSEIYLGNLKFKNKTKQNVGAESGDEKRIDRERE